MQIQHRVLRVAAATSVTMFLVAGAIGPVYATDGADGKTTTRSHSTARADHSDGNASTTGDSTEPQPESTADENDGGANAGDCDEATEPSTSDSDQAAESDGTAGSDETAASDETADESDSSDSTDNNYCSTRDGSASQNGEGDGNATGKPCAGCVGKADNKNPKGQAPDGSDANNGYECDGNNGIGKSNPAHTGCSSEDVSPEDEQSAETCPSDESEDPCVPPTTDNGSTSSGEVLGVEAERTGANRAGAEVAPASSGLLPETGAGRYGLPIAAGMLLLGTGGVLLLRKRPQAGR